MSYSADSRLAPPLALAWYFHLPSIATEIEVVDHAQGSLALLLRVHREHHTPVLIAPSGSFLSLCRKHAPEVLDDLLAAHDMGLVALATTYFHEVDPFSISWHHLREHLRRDHAVKEELIGTGPEWFLAPNFTWHPALDRLLDGLGIGGAILDSRHFAAATTARTWKWSTDDDGTVLATDTPASVAAWEHRRVRALAARNGSTLRLVFRDWPITRRLTFGNDSAIHRPDCDPREPLEHVGDGDLVVIADDGDRIRPASRRGYEKLLRLGRCRVSWDVLAEVDSVLPSLRELPAFTQPGLDELVRMSIDARFYWSMLDQIAGYELDSGQLETLLALQDVFYPFWRGCGRRRWYLDTAVELLESVQRDRDALRSPRRSLNGALR